MGYKTKSIFYDLGCHFVSHAANFSEFIEAINSLLTEISTRYKKYFHHFLHE
jgi:hypothetical protein